MASLKFFIKELILISFTIVAVVLLDHFKTPGSIYITVSFIFVLSFVLIGLTYSKLKKRNELIDNLNTYANSLSGTGDQIFDSCKQINMATDEQSSAVFETSSAADEISAMAKRSLSNVAEVKTSISDIHEIIIKSDTNAKQLGKTYTELENENQKMAKVLEESVSMLEDLTVLFKEVTDKTAVINDIVFQTKLLSFNASVEAARAGEHGKGFSVVAEEIGNLANISGESALAIQDILEKTQGQVTSIRNDITSSSESAIRNLNLKIETGNEIVNDFQNNFTKVKNYSEEILRQIDQVSSASDEQTKGIQELRNAIHLVNETVQRNSLVVSQTTDLAKLLNSEMNALQSDIKTFKEEDDKNYQDLVPLIPWSEKYEMGVSQMDSEHKELLKRINTLINAMNKNTGIKKSFESLAQYTVKHFTEEESYMEQISYPALESHKKVHENLLKAVNGFGAQIDSGTVDKTKLASFLKNWLFTHIMGVDTKYAKHSLDGHNNKNVA